MGPCDPRERSNSTESNRTPQDPDASERTPDNDANNVEEVSESEVVWEAMAAAGYTPLMDSGTAMFSDGEGRTMITSDGGAFYSAFEQLLGEESDDEDSPDAVETDFRSVADRALMSLEEEYRRVLEGDSSANGGRATIPIFQASEKEDQSPAMAICSFPGESDGAALEVDKMSTPCVEKESSGGVSSISIPGRNEESQQLPKNEIPEIDTDAVTRAVQAINLRRPKLSSNMQEWEIQKLEETTRAPRLHAIIPSQPLAAFRKNTEKAVAATQNLSRSACIAESLVRLDALRSQDTLTIHCVGCDGVECNSDDSIRLFFGPVVRWIGAAAEAPKKIEFHLIGPNIPTAMTTRAIELMPAGETRLLGAIAFCHASLYQDWLDANPEGTANLAIAFNAGVWGYKEWRSTINNLLCRNSLIPFVFTAYTLPEAEDDAEVLQEELQKKLGFTEDKFKARCLWEAEMNPYASRKERKTHTGTKGRKYRENCAWQGWRL